MEETWELPAEKSESAIATLPASRYSIFLEVKDLAGNPVLCALTLTPTGFSSTTPALFWTRLLSNLAKRDRNWITRWEEDVDSLRGGRQQGLPF